MRWSTRKLFAARYLSRQPLANRYRPNVELLEARQLLSFTPTPVYTYHNDLMRTGQNLTESTLTPDVVNTDNFGRLYSYPVDGQVYAQPLYVPNVTLKDGSVHNIVYVATEHDSVYAFDANGGGLLWQDSFIDPANGITPFSVSDALNCGQITPELGITDAPVIDPDAGVMYLVAQFKQVANGQTTYHQQLHALDITTGYEVDNGPVEIQASVVNDSGHTVTFNPRYYKERAALTLIGGTVFTAWASHCDDTPSNGWVIGYSARGDVTQQDSVFNTSPNGNLDTIWQGNGGLASDGQGLYFETGNGTDITGHGDDYSEAFVRLRVADGATVDDYFIPSNYRALDQADRDIGSGAPIVLPDQPGDNPHLLVGAGKDGRIFLINRDNMGGLNNPPDGPDLIVQELPNNTISGGSWDTPAYFDAGDPNGPYIYYVGNGDFAKAFQLTNGLFNSAHPVSSQSPTRFSGSYGATPIISANGTQGGILWALERGNNLVLHAYDATDLSNELYNSNQNPADRMGAGVKFASPIVADGEVFVPTNNSLEIFGLTAGLHPGRNQHGRQVRHEANPALTPAVIAALANTSDLSQSLIVETAVVSPLTDARINLDLAGQVRADTRAVVGDDPASTPAVLSRPASDPALVDTTVALLNPADGLN